LVLKDIFLLLFVLKSTFFVPKVLPQVFSCVNPLPRP